LICRGHKSKTDIILKNKKYFTSLIKIKNIDVGENIEKPAQSSTAVINDVEIFLPFADLIDLDKELDRLKLKILDVEGRLNSVKSKLNNENFVQRAPKEIVDHEKKKYNNYKNDYDKLVMNLNSLSS
jgi:valyl-tRNA synthetase